MTVSHQLWRLWHCFDYDSREVSAWMRAAVARGPETVVGSLFTSTALLFVAKELDEDCDDRVNIGLNFTLKITSVLSASSVVENVVNAVLSPYWGALADTTSNRKLLLVLSSVTWVSMVAIGAVLLFFEASLTLLYLFFFSILFTIIFYELALMLIFAYLPEIVDDEDQLTAITSRQYAIVNALQLFAAAVLVGVTFALPEDTFENDLPLSIMAHFLVVVIWCYYGVPGLIRLPSRKKGKSDRDRESDDATDEAIAKGQKQDAIEDEEGNGEDGDNGENEGNAALLKKKKVRKSVAAKAFGELVDTVKEIYEHYPNVGWFLLAWMFFFAGVSSVTLLQVAYVSEEFDYSTTEVSYLGALVLIFSVIGAVLAEHLSKRFKLKTLLLTAILIWSGVCFVGPYLLRGEDLETPETENITEGNCDEVLNITRQPTTLGELMAFVFACFVGLGVGFIYPVNTSIYAVLIPGGREASYFGLKTFGSKVISWAPPLVFTLINEQTDDLQLAFMSLGFFFAASIPFIMKMNVEQGMVDVKHTLVYRQGTGKHNFDARHQMAKEGFSEVESVVDENGEEIEVNAKEDVEEAVENSGPTTEEGSDGKGGDDLDIKASEDMNKATTAQQPSL